MMGGPSPMTPYTPTSTPVMSQAGSTLGGGMSSPMNLGPAAGSQMGAASGSQVAPSAVSQALNMMRGITSQQQQQQAPAAQGYNKIQAIYKMFPSLRPGAQMGQHGQVGGFNG
jgi:hypothetical protein